MGKVNSLIAKFEHLSNQHSETTKKVAAKPTHKRHSSNVQVAAADQRTGRSTTRDAADKQRARSASPAQRRRPLPAVTSAMRAEAAKRKAQAVQSQSRPLPKIPAETKATLENARAQLADMQARLATIKQTQAAESQQLGVTANATGKSTAVAAKLAALKAAQAKLAELRAAKNSSAHRVPTAPSMDNYKAAAAVPSSALTEDALLEAKDLLKAAEMVQEAVTVDVASEEVQEAVTVDVATEEVAQEEVTVTETEQTKAASSKPVDKFDPRALLKSAMSSRRNAIADDDEWDDEETVGTKVETVAVVNKLDNQRVNNSAFAQLFAPEVRQRALDKQQKASIVSENSASQGPVEKAETVKTTETIPTPPPVPMFATTAGTVKSKAELADRGDLNAAIRGFSGGLKHVAAKAESKQNTPDQFKSAEHMLQRVQQMVG